jgi:hypothetical protein
MPKVITAREAEELLRKGEAPPAGAILTPSARDVLGGGSLQSAFRGTGARAVAKPASAPAAAVTPSTPDLEFRWTPGADPRTPAEIAAFFLSPALLWQLFPLSCRMWPLPDATACVAGRWCCRGFYVLRFRGTAKVPSLSKHLSVWRQENYSLTSYNHYTKNGA